MGVLFFLWRLFEFAFFGFVHGVRFSLRALRRAVFRRGPGVAECMGLFITELFESLGATFVKVGQVMSTRPDVLPEEITRPLTRLQDSVAPFDVNLIPGIIEQQTGMGVDDLFSEFDTHPISAASVAHVHKATLHDGRVVAVKIRRPGLLRKVRYDLLVLKIFADFLNLFIPGLHLVSLPEMIDEFGAQIYKQLDFRKEAANNRRFAENFSADEGVRVPALIDELCTDALLVMEFIEGLLQVGNHEMSTEQRRRAAVVAAHTFFQMIYGDGFIHADMHPGNVFFLKDGTFVLLDLGLVAELAESDFRDNSDFFYGLITGNGKECARVIMEGSTWKAKSFRPEDFEREVVDLVARSASVAAGDFEVSEFSGAIFDIQRRHGLRSNPNFATTIVSMIVFEGIAKMLDPDMDFQLEGRNYFAKRGARRYTPRAQGTAKRADTGFPAAN